MYIIKLFRMIYQYILLKQSISYIQLNKHTLYEQGNDVCLYIFLKTFILHLNYLTYCILIQGYIFKFSSKSLMFFYKLTI